MKYRIVVLLLPFLAGCVSESIVLHGKISNAGSVPVVYQRSFDGVFNPLEVDTLPLRPDGTFRVSMPAKRGERIAFYLFGERRLGGAYLVPGENRMHIDLAASGELQVENDSGEEGRIVKELWNLDCDVSSSRTRQGDPFQIRDDTVAVSVYRKLTACAARLEASIAGVDDAFRKMAVQDIRMQLLLVFFDRYLGVRYRGPERIRQEWNRVFPEMVAFADVNRPENVFSPAFADVVSYMAGISLSMQENRAKPENADARNRMLFDWYHENLQGRVRETAHSFIFLNDRWQEQYAPGIPELYEEFERLYPTAALMSAVREAVAGNRAFNRTEFPAGVRILETDSVRTFREITDRYRGKVVFIDIWATSCGPCRQSFARVGPLQRYAEENGVVLLYLSLDDSAHVDLWRKMAGYYGLEGVHVRVNSFFRDEVYELFGQNGRLAIPHCAIIDKRGELQFPSAESPENMERLLEQLQAAAQ